MGWGEAVTSPSGHPHRRAAAPGPAQGREIIAEFIYQPDARAPSSPPPPPRLLFLLLLPAPAFSPPPPPSPPLSPSPHVREWPIVCRQQIARRPPPAPPAPGVCSRLRGAAGLSLSSPPPLPPPAASPLLGPPSGEIPAAGGRGAPSEHPGNPRSITAHPASLRLEGREGKGRASPAPRGGLLSPPEQEGGEDGDEGCRERRLRALPRRRGSLGDETSFHPGKGLGSRAAVHPPAEPGFGFRRGSPAGDAGSTTVTRAAVLKAVSGSMREQSRAELQPLP